MIVQILKHWNELNEFCFEAESGHKKGSGQKRSPGDGPLPSV